MQERIDTTHGVERVREGPELSVPDRLGDYRILSRLGEGGMGVVFEAEQQHPRRRVAVKLLRGGPFADELRLKMFQREIDTLARLKHPNIGAIYESGCTADGQHFFAMELVRGETLESHLARRTFAFDRKELARRLRLFRRIAEAVHYAHQRGVIHRDLKPSNIVVTGVSEVKILDFGLARIADPDVAGGTVVTQVGTIRGTLAYMSPEQTRGHSEDVDVRTDVYALGVILYEMLTGARPYDTATTTLVEAVRVICEEPPKPLSRSWKASRKLDADLETIVNTAIEKEPDRRYASAAALAEDVGRYLSSQPIQARPPSTAYQLAKLVSRHKLSFSFAAILALLLLGFGLGMSVLYARAVAAEAQAVDEARMSESALGFMIEMFSMSDPSEARGKTITAREILDRSATKIEAEFRDRPEAQARLMGTMGWVYRGLGLYEDAEPLLERAVELRREILGAEHPKTLRSANDLAVLYENLGRSADAEALHADTLATQRRVLGPDHRDTLLSMSNLAVLYQKQRRFELAQPLFAEALAIQQRVLGPDHPETLRSMNNLAVLYTQQRRYDEAEPLHRAALAGRRRVLGGDHPETLNSMNNLAVFYDEQGRHDEAEPLYLEALEGQRRVLGPEHPETLTCRYNLANLYLRQGRAKKAESMFLATLEGLRRVRGENHPDTLDALYNLACASAILGHRQAAIGFLREAVDRGYTYRGNPAGMLTDPDLASLHGDPAFEAIAERIEKLAAGG